LSLRETHARAFARSCVRAGLLGEHELYDEVALAVRSELPALAGSAEAVARDWVGEFREELAVDQAGWPAVTDHDRLQAAFAEITAAGVVVLQGCEDHWAAKALLDARSSEVPRGIAWFTPPDVWHAIDEGMLEVNLWHGSTANAAPGDALLDDVLAVFARHDLAAHFDEGRIEVATFWQRRFSS